MSNSEQNKNNRSKPSSGTQAESGVSHPQKWTRRRSGEASKIGRRMPAYPR
jgi:hypothetical protein